MAFVVLVVAAGCSSDQPQAQSPAPAPTAPGTQTVQPPPVVSPPPVVTAPPVAVNPPATNPGVNSTTGDVPDWAGKQPHEPFDVKAFLLSRAAPPDNAAPLYIAALTTMFGSLDDPNETALGKELAEIADAEKLATGGVSPERVTNTLTKAAQGLA